MKQHLNKQTLYRSLTPNVRALLILPLADSGFEWSIGVTGKDDVLFTRGVNNLVNDHDLGIDTFSCGTMAEVSESGKVAFSVSEFILRNLKLSLGKRFLMDDLPLHEEGLGKAFTLELEGLGVKRKFTLFGVGVGVESILTCTDTWLAASDDLEGISTNRFGLFHCLACSLSSVIPEELSPWKEKTRCNSFYETWTIAHQDR